LTIATPAAMVEKVLTKGEVGGMPEITTARDALAGRYSLYSEFRILCAAAKDYTNVGCAKK
jgi:hypothetical protein